MSSSMISINYVYVLPLLKTKQPLPFIKFHAYNNHIMDKSKFRFLVKISYNVSRFQLA